MLTLHDCLSLGEVHRGLTLPVPGNGTTNSSSDDNDNNNHNNNGTDTTNVVDQKQHHVQEIHRLPMLLRLLSMTRPLASPGILEAIQNLDSTNASTDMTRNEETGDTQSSSSKKKRTSKTGGTTSTSLFSDTLVNQTVQQLEHVAALYSVAEGVDVITNHLVPTMTRKLSRVPPLQHHRQQYQQQQQQQQQQSNSEEQQQESSKIVWDTLELEQVARDPKGNPKPTKNTTTMESNAVTGKRKRTPVLTKSNNKTKQTPSTKDATSTMEHDESKLDIAGEDSDKDNDESNGFLSSNDDNDDDDHDDDDDDDNNDNNNNEDDDNNNNNNSDQPPRKKRRTIHRNSKLLNRRESMDVAAEDSQEATLIKTISELVTLVITSLEPIVAVDDKEQDTANDADDDGQQQSQNGGEEHQQQQQQQQLQQQPPPPPQQQSQSQQQSEQHQHHPPTGSQDRSKGQFLLTLDDSILAESEKDSAAAMGGIEGGDPGSMVAAILHHAPALLSRHVAQALCRANVPQLGALMTRLGANCPTTVASLLLGCMEAYILAIQQKSRPIANIAKKAVLALAKLSPRESSRVLERLSEKKIMWDVQLELTLQERDDNPTSIMCLLIAQLSESSNLLTFSGNNDRTMNPPSDAQCTAEVPLDYAEKNGYSFDSQKPSEEPSLQQHLIEKPNLFEQTLRFFAQQFEILAKRKRLPRGYFVFSLRAFCWLLLVPCSTIPSSDRMLPLQEKVLPSLHKLIEKTMDIVLLDDKTNLAVTSTMDQLFTLLHSCLILTSARILQGANVNDATKESCQELHVLLRQFPPVSKTVLGFRQQVDSALRQEQSAVVLAQIVNVLGSPHPSISTHLAASIADMDSGLRAVCSLLKPWTLQKHSEDKEIGDLEATISTLLFEIDTSNATDGSSSAVVDTLQRVLTDDSVSVLQHIPNNILARFVSASTRKLSEDSRLNIPLVLPTQIEREGSKLKVSQLEQGLLDEHGAKFLLQLLHVFEYLDIKKNSPFCFDPRSIPLKQALTMSHVLSPLRGTISFLGRRLQELSQRHCPDIVLQFQRTQDITSTNKEVLSSSRTEVMDTLYKALRLFIEGPDPEATGAERIFLQAKSTLCDADLYSTVCSAFLASPNEPKPVLTYYFLCRDPLVLFKCPVKIWRRRSLRRIALDMLSSSLEANTAIAHNSTSLESSTGEYLASRNCVVVRCLLMCICGTGPKITPIYCVTTTGLVRSIISGHPGLVASLIKQGVPENVLDWLVENVPECINDSADLLQLLSDHSSLTSTERLVVADAVLRIAIVHGHSNDHEAAHMAQTALSQLVESFFLVVGPVGVPVDALINEDSGLDVTQTSRKAAFRILKSLLQVRGRRSSLRRECANALQKLAGLCRSESALAGVAGAVAGRRKSLMKEMYDLIIKASNSMAAVPEA